MTNLFYMTILGSIFTIFLMAFKNILIKKYGGVWYYYIWILVLICYCIPYKFDIGDWFRTTKFQQEYMNFSKHETTQNIVTIHTEQNDDDNNNIIIPVNQYDNHAIYEISAKQILLCVYFTGFILFLLYYCIRYITFQKNLKNTTESVTNEVYLDCFYKIRSEMGIIENVALKQSDMIHSPIFVGILKPMVILPNIDIDMADFNMIIKHELMHCKRSDMIYRFVAILVHIIHWFNPISYFMLYHINVACEYSCDEILTKNMSEDSKIKYGNMLLNQIEYHTKNNYYTATWAQNNKNVLKTRISIIKSDKKYKRVSITLLFLCSTVICSNFFSFYKINGNVSNQVNYNEEKNLYDNESQQYSKQNNIQMIHKHFAQILTEHQLKHIEKFQQDVKYNESNNIKTQIRELTESEKQRITKLRYEYIEKGVRPQNALNTIPLDTQQFYIDFSNRVFHYPERELTDEEILQLVEWDLVVEYANSLQYHYNIGIDDITEQQAIQTAKQYVEKLFDADTQNLKLYANYYYDSNIQPDGWFIRLYTEGDMPYELNWNYAVWIYEEKQKQYITVSRSSQNYEYEMINESSSVINDESWLYEARAIVAQKLGKTHIQYASIINMENNNKIKQNTVDVKVTMNDGSDYMVCLYYPHKTLKAITMPIQ